MVDVGEQHEKLAGATSNVQDLDDREPCYMNIALNWHEWAFGIDLEDKAAGIRFGEHYRPRFVPRPMVEEYEPRTLA